MTDEVIRKLLKRASMACYFKEDYENKAQRADLIEQRDFYLKSAEYFADIEKLWLEAVAIVKGERE